MIFRTQAEVFSGRRARGGTLRSPGAQKLFERSALSAFKPTAYESSHRAEAGAAALLIVLADLGI